MSTFARNTLFLSAFLISGIVCRPHSAGAEVPVDDSYTFVTDEETGALYECSAYGCVLVAAPTPASDCDSCTQEEAKACADQGCISTTPPTTAL